MNMIMNIKEATYTLIILVFVMGLIVGATWLATTHRTQQQWGVVNTSIGVLYLAGSPQLMAKGYKDKDLYDFAGKGAVGMLFPIYVLKPTHVCFTMRDVKLPLVLIIAQRTDAKSRDFVVHYKVLMQPNASDFCLSDMHLAFTYDVIAIELSPDVAGGIKRGDIITVYSTLP
jgi:uncharacterized membrane protein (UPF0127 family)